VINYFYLGNLLRATYLLTEWSRR